MKIQRVTLREIQMRLIAPFETSFGRTTERRILLIEAEAGGATGWGECVAGEGPFYSPETVDTAWLILEKYLWPLLKGREFAAASEIWELLEPVRGHNMAKGALESALWDAEAKQKGVPLWRLLGGVREEIASGVSIGIKPTFDELLAAVEKELSAGYQRIKIKIKPGRDIEPVERLRQRFPSIKLMVDANSAYRLEDAPHLRRLEPFYLMMIEQPLGWDDLFGHVALQRQLQTPICLDECIRSLEHARAAIGLNACSIINMKLGRVGGYTPALAIHDLCRAHQHLHAPRGRRGRPLREVAPGGFHRFCGQFRVSPRMDPDHFGRVRRVQRTQFSISADAPAGHQQVVIAPELGTHIRQRRFRRGANPEIGKIRVGLIPKHGQSRSRQHFSRVHRGGLVQTRSRTLLTAPSASLRPRSNISAASSATLRPFSYNSRPRSTTARPCSASASRPSSAFLAMSLRVCLPLVGAKSNAIAAPTAAPATNHTILLPESS